ncbi:MAG TPA: calcium-binding protein [Nitrososphaeraceae archaeon]|nr:calcium-binding protein [Nitrososphaeraceae archaeon]
MIAERKNVNCNNTNSIIYKLLLLHNNNFKFSKNFILHFSLFCIFVYFFIVFLDTDTKYWKHNIIDNAWSDEFNGTEQADAITGTLKGDTIRGFYGNDALMGNEGGDDISGGSGDDMIYGNEGRDILKGKAGNDIIQGGEGNDKIYGDRGNDILVGAEGNDILTGGYGIDVFICGTASDTITDFNVTQKDTTPYDDCENIKNISGVQSESLLSQQQGQNIENKNNKEMIDNTDTIKDEQNQDNGFFFGLFK